MAGQYVNVVVKQMSVSPGGQGQGQEDMLLLPPATQTSCFTKFGPFSVKTHKEE
ncbi:hypothetical protein BGX26_004636, partial [Mortierella sp. AD094]